MKYLLSSFRKLVVAALFLGVSLTGWSVNYYVNDNSSTGDVYTTALGNNANSGLTAALPKASLTEIWNTYGPSGTNVITSGDIIFVDAGTYLALDANLALSVSGISITGAGSSLTFFDNNQTSTDANRWATITGDNITITGVYLTGYNYGFGDANVVQITGVSGLILNDLIVNENLPGGGSSSIVVTGGSEVDFIGGGSSCNPGSASVAGGGVNVEGNGNDVSFTDYTFATNTKDFQGGSGLRITGDATTTVDVDDCIFLDNTNSSSEGGGAIFIANGASITIDGSCFSGNSSNQTSSVNYGGALMAGRGSTATITNCTFDGNSATSSGNGGALAVNTGLGSTGTTGTITVTTCAFTANAASDGADILGRVSFSRPAVINISECTFSGTADDIRNDNSATITVANSGSPSTTGTVTFTNTTAPVTTPTTNCPTAPQPCYTVLPVTFDDFWAGCDSDENIQLNWKTISEVNNDRFILERASEDLQFQDVAEVSGSGTTTNSMEYSYVDRDALATAYYRLSQVDYDGSRTYLKTIFATSCRTGNAIYAHQFDSNKNKIEIFYHLEEVELVNVSLIDASGSILHTERKRLIPDSQVSKCDIKQHLQPGMYLIYVETKSESYQGKILVVE
ncbi:MAG: hypothetical protein Crog4KO_27460 [Crocinitomicaceae bacterium]